MPTPNLGLPYLIASQASKEVTHNEALDLLDDWAQTVEAGLEQVGTPPPTPTLAATTPTLATAYVASDNAGTTIYHERFSFSRQVEQSGTAVADRNSVRGRRGDNSTVGSFTLGQLRASSVIHAQAFEWRFKAQNGHAKVYITNLSDQNPERVLAFDSDNPGAIDWDGLSTGTAYYLKFDYGAENGRQFLKVEVEVTGYFYGFNVGSVVDSVWAAPDLIGPLTHPDLIVIGDSIAGAANTNGQTFDAYPKKFARLMGGGLNVVLLPAGGSGYIEDGNKMVYVDRMAPPGSPLASPAIGNLPGAAYRITNTLGGAGTFTITHNAVTTGEIVYSSNDATLKNNIQAALDTAFGLHSYDLPKARVSFTDWGWVLAFDEGTGAPTFGYTGVTGALTVGDQWLGDVDKVVKRDAAGKPFPFNTLVQAGNNDSGIASAKIKAAALRTWQDFLAVFPMASLVLQGPPPTDSALANTSGSGGISQYLEADTALYEQAQASLPLVGGFVPYISPWAGTKADVGTTRQANWFTGTGRLGAPAGDGSNDLFTSDDGIHPSTEGQTALAILTWLGYSHFWRQGTPEPDGRLIVEYSTPGTYSIDVDELLALGYETVDATLIGGGGGGGSGRKGAAAQNRTGGGGGAGGGYSKVSLPLSVFGSTLALTVGAAGVGGAAVSTSSTSGNPGTNGGDSFVGPSASTALIFAGGGALGAGGGTGVITASTGGAGSQSGGNGGATGSAGAAGGAGANGSGFAPAGGGNGGGITSADVANIGGAGGFVSAGYRTGGTSGAAATAGGAAASVTTGLGAPAGGGGGASTSGTNAGDGGLGGSPGGGGGGGGAGLNATNNSGAGGNGGAGYARLEFRRK